MAAYATTDDIAQRRIDVLGVVQGIPVGVAANNQVTPLVTLGNVAYPAPAKRIVVVAVGIVLSVATLPPPGNLFFNFGTSGPSYTDWGQSDNFSFYTSGILVWPYPAPLAEPQNPVYGPGTVFSCLNQSGLATNLTGTFTVYGWAT